MTHVPDYFDQRQLLHRPSRELHGGSWADYAETPERARVIAEPAISNLPETLAWNPHHNDAHSVLGTMVMEAVELLRRPRN